MIEPEQLNLIIRVRGANSLLNTIYITDYTHTRAELSSALLDNIYITDYTHSHPDRAQLSFTR